MAKNILFKSKYIFTGDIRVMLNSNRILNLCIIQIIFLACAIYLESRSFSLGYLVSIFLIFRLYYKKLISWKVIAFTAVLLITVAVILIFYIKADSSSGRLLIYKISYRILKENWVNGIGLGNFKTTYLFYQAEFFKAGNYTSKELLLPDNTYFAFNDYYQFIIETGIKGVFVILIFFIAFYKMLMHKIKNNTINCIYSFSIAQLMAILVASCFTYVLYQHKFQIITTILLIVVFYYSFENHLAKGKILYAFVTLTILLIVVLAEYNFSLNYYFSLQKVKNIKNIHRAGYVIEAKTKMNELYPVLKNNPVYLEALSFMLSDNMDLRKAEIVTEKLLKYQISYNLYLRLGTLYMMQKKYDDAEKAYLMAINMVPNRFLSRYKLYQLYIEMHNLSKAKTTAMNILALPVKIPSKEVDQIKNKILRDFEYNFK